MLISDIKIKSRKKKKRVGRGPSSGKGKTSGRGTKGQKSRSGYSRKPQFEGGQTPLSLRLPKKRGFKNIFAKPKEIVNLSDLEKLKKESKIDIEILKKYKLIKSEKSAIKILGNGKLTRKIEIEADGFSKNAKKEIEKAGGKIIVRKHIKKEEVKKE